MPKYNKEQQAAIDLRERLFLSVLLPAQEKDKNSCSPFN